MQACLQAILKKNHAQLREIMYQEDSFKTSQVVYAHTRSDEADMEYKMHCHNSYEIYYMVKGNVEYFWRGLLMYQSLEVF